jgi:hypothetical protein
MIKFDEESDEPLIGHKKNKSFRRYIILAVLSFILAIFTVWF